MKRVVQKVYNGKISIRDYEMKNCIDRGEDLEIVFKDYTMTIPKDKVCEGIHTKNFQPARWGMNPTYELIDYPWRPDIKAKEEPTPPKQGKLFDVRF